MSHTDELETQWAECERILQYKFSDRALLRQSLTHASIATTRLHSYERLEFLGDAILGSIVCEMLYHKYPHFSEGDLTKLKSSLVSRITCAAVCQDLGLGRYLLLGNGLMHKGEIPSFVQAGALEAVVAAVYFDGGLEEVRSMVERWMSYQLDKLLLNKNEDNFKSLLQQMSQKSTGVTPVYKLADEQGPDHDKMFQISAIVGDREFEPAWGASKKEAEQAAAKIALETVEQETVASRVAK